MTKLLNGSELAGFIKERQVNEVAKLRAQGTVPKLVIIRDNDEPVIKKYVKLKQKYGEDIGVEVKDELVKTSELKTALQKANNRDSVHGIIVQLPLKITTINVDDILTQIAPEKDVDGLSGMGRFDSATATAINWLLAAHNVELSGKKIAVVGRGRLVGAPLAKMWRGSGLNITVLHRGDDLQKLADFDVIVTGTGVPNLIKSEMVADGAVVVDAGTASEDGAIVGDIEDILHNRKDIAAITPRVGGVGPLTVGVLFENVIRASKEA